jgi:hypothetical protein
VFCEAGEALKTGGAFECSYTFIRPCSRFGMQSRYELVVDGVITDPLQELILQQRRTRGARAAVPLEQ